MRARVVRACLEVEGRLYLFLLCFPLLLLNASSLSNFVRVIEVLEEHARVLLLLHKSTLLDFLFVLLPQLPFLAALLSLRLRLYVNCKKWLSEKRQLRNERWRHLSLRYSSPVILTQPHVLLNLVYSVEA